MDTESGLVIHNNYNLQALNTLGTPAIAEYFTELKQESEFLSLLSFVEKKKCRLFLLGGGSNVILPEKIDGIVARIATQGRQIISETEDDITLRFAAGEEWHAVVMWAAEQGWYGIENLALIPGSVGAAPIQNIGAYGVELESCCEKVEGLRIATGDTFQLTRDDCQFAYRESIFKGELKDNCLITHVTLRLSKRKKINASYPALREQLNALGLNDDSLSAMDIANAVIAVRQSKLPDPKEIPNVGSFFKNPIVTQEKLKIIKNNFPEVVSYPVGEGRVKLAAGWLLDAAGWRGKQVDRVAMHSQQALVLVNPEKVTSKQVLAFADLVKQSIREHYDIELEIEPIIVV